MLTSDRTATEKVFNTPELVEAICLNLPLRDILRTMQVSQFVHNVINSSTTIPAGFSLVDIGAGHVEGLVSEGSFLMQPTPAFNRDVLFDTSIDRPNSPSAQISLPGVTTMFSYDIGKIMFLASPCEGIERGRGFLGTRLVVRSEDKTRGRGPFWRGIRLVPATTEAEVSVWWLMARMPVPKDITLGQLCDLLVMES